MPYRINATKSQPCLVCSVFTKRTCRNCSGSHCEMHMPGASCGGCEAELWAMERKRLSSVGNGVLASAVVAIAAAAFVGSSAVLAWPLAVGYLLLAPIAVLGWRGVIRRKLANHKLMPTSQPMCLPAPSEGVVSIAKKKESNYDIRRRRNKSKGGRGSGGGVRAVFMTRGGHFYQ